MKSVKKLTLLLATVLLSASCSVKYNFTGTGKIEGKTFQVTRFLNNSAIVEPGLNRNFTLKLQEIIQNQTNLNLTNSGGDLQYEGEITDYTISPMTATADQKAAQNRLTIRVNVRFKNTKNEKDDFEKVFSHYYDYPAESQLVGTTLTAAYDEIFTRITQDIFNESLAKW